MDNKPAAQPLTEAGVASNSRLAVWENLFRELAGSARDCQAIFRNSRRHE